MTNLFDGANRLIDLIHGVGTCPAVIGRHNADHTHMCRLTDLHHLHQCACTLTWTTS